MFAPPAKWTVELHAETADTKERQEMRTPSAYKRSPALTNSTWYKGMLHSQMAGTTDNNGVLDFVIHK